MICYKLTTYYTKAAQIRRTRKMDRIKKWTLLIDKLVERKQGGAVAATLCECPCTPEHLESITETELLDCIRVHSLSEVTFYFALARMTTHPAKRFQLCLAAFEAFAAFHMERRPQPPVGWDTAILVTLLREVHRAAIVPDAVSESGVGDVLRSYRKLFLFLQSADANYPNDVARRRGALAVLNGLLSILLEQNNTHQCQAMVATVEQAEKVAGGDPMKGILGPCGHMVAEVVKYLYVSARLQLYSEQPHLAFPSLRRAYALMPPLNEAMLPVQKNKIRVAFYWLVAGVLCGIRPPSFLLSLSPVMEKFFGALYDAIESSDLLAFDALLQQHHELLKARAVYILLFGARQWVVLTALKRVVAILKHEAEVRAGQTPTLDPTRVPLAAVQAALAAASADAEGNEHCAEDDGYKVQSIKSRLSTQMPSASIPDLEGTALIIARLITQGYVKGYISLEHQMLVLSRVQPFPQPYSNLNMP